MKPIQFILLSILIAASVSCKKYLDLVPTSNQATTNFFKSESDITQALTGTYNVLLGYPDVNYYNLSEIRSNNYYIASVDAQRDYFSINHYQLTSALPMLETSWTMGYRMIGRANQILDVIDNISFADSTKKQRTKAEARFLRAFAYFDLVKVFGAVPLVKTTITSEQAADYPRVGIDTVYAFIVNELQNVANTTALPYKYTAAADKGRVTRLAALGLLGKVYMFMAGFPLNKTEYYENAKMVLQQVLAQENISWTFAPSYAQLFKTANDNAYYLFEVQYLSGGQGQGNPIPGEVVPGDMTTQLLPFGAYYISGAPSRDLINSYEPNDKRLLLTVDTLYRNKTNVIIARDYVKKFLDSAAATTIKSSSDWPINFPLLRSEDVMLLYAEAVNKTTGPTAEAIGIVNRIRTRAGLPDINPATQEDFRLALEKERRHEFAWEGVYWYDLVRTNRFIDVMNPWLQQNYQKTIDQTQYIYPVPLPELNVFPGLYYQNQGYQ